MVNLVVQVALGESPGFPLCLMLGLESVAAVVVRPKQLDSSFPGGLALQLFIARLALISEVGRFVWVMGGLSGERETAIVGRCGVPIRRDQAGIRAFVTAGVSK